MIFPDYGIICDVAGCIGFFGIVLLLFRIVRSSKSLIRTPIQIISAMLAMCSGGVLLLFGCASAFNVTVTTHSAPIYSPDHLRAMRITDVDAGALGGYSFITLYSHHGLIGRTIFSGDSEAANLQTVRWINNSEVLIGHHADYHYPPKCDDASRVSVKCEPVVYSFKH